MSICIGGCCIPVSLLWPLVLLAIKPIYDFLAGIFGWKPLSSTPIQEKMECKGGVCKMKTNTEANANNEDIKNEKCGVSDADKKMQLDQQNYIKLEADKHSEEDFMDIIKSSDICFLKFTASWCKPCKDVEPHYAALSKKFKSSLFLTVDVEEYENIALSYKTKSLPYFVAMTGNDGKEIASLAGKDEVKLTQFVEAHCKKNN